MASKQEWDYALVLKGVTPSRLPMSKLADYLRDWAALLGEGNRPIFRGVTRGSVVLKARVDEDRKTETKVRLLQAKSQPDASAARYVEALNKSMRRDELAGQIVSRQGDVIMELNQVAVHEPNEREYTLSDAGVLDGVVVGIGGTDDTVHVRLQESSGAVWSIALRDFSLARQLAKHFRADPIRVMVHGTWKRTGSGIWEPFNLFTEGFEELDSRSAKLIMDELRAIPGNGWATLDNGAAFWADLRGGT